MINTQSPVINNQGNVNPKNDIKRENKKSEGKFLYLSKWLWIIIGGILVFAILATVIVIATK